MNAQKFLAEFGHITNAPGGVARLRELILDLAIRGQLLPPSERASDAGTLLSEIAAFRHDLISAGKLRRPTPQADIDDSELTFALPKGWAFERLGNVCEIVRGVTFPSSKKQTTPAAGAVACLRTTNIQAEIDWNDLIYIDPEFVGRGDQWVEPGDTMISMANSYELVGKVALVREVKQCATFGGFIAAVRPHVLEPDYLYLLLRSPYMQARMRVTASQTTNIANISLGGMRPIPTPIPPKEEQSRIVAKVDELMALCDQLEAQQQDRRKLQNALRQSTLQALASAQSPHELQESWQRLQANFGRLFSEPEDVRELRLVVMELAIRGLLTEQLISDGDAAELVFAAPAAASSTRGRKRSAFLKEEISESDLPFALPKNWRWARLADIGYFLGGGTPSKSNPDYWQGPIPWVSPKDMKVARINSSQDHISEKALSESAAKLIPAGSLLVVVRGMILAHSFPVGLTSREVAINQDMKALCPHRSDMGEFLLLLLAGSKQRFLELVERSTHGTCRLETDRFASCVVGIPPLTEQLRIVESVNQLMLVCDVLQSQLNEMRKCLATLAITSVANLTGITIEQEQDPCESPANSTDRPERHRQVLMKNL